MRKKIVPVEIANIYADLPKGAWTQLSSSLIDVVSSVIRRQFKEEPEDAYVEAVHVVLCLSSAVGGSLIYLPQNDLLLRALDYELTRLESGSNNEELYTESDELSETLFKRYKDKPVFWPVVIRTI